MELELGPLPAVTLSSWLSLSHSTTLSEAWFENFFSIAF